MPSTCTPRAVHPARGRGNPPAAARVLGDRIRRMAGQLGIGRQGPLPSARDTGRAMSQENVEIVRAAFDAFTRGDTCVRIRPSRPPGCRSSSAC
jgi:hypothetical protein